mgnify:CR=1 FL=1
MTRQQARNYRHVSFSDYLRLEMTGTMNNELTHDTDGALGWQEQQLVVSMLQVPYHVESLMMYGLAARKVSTWLKGNPRLLNTISACVLIIIAIIIAIRT